MSQDRSPATLGETPRVDAMLLSQERRSAIYFPLRLDETIALARTLERELSGIPEGRRSPPAGALESGSPLATSDATPGSAVPGPASIEEEFGLNRPLMMFLWSIPTGYQIHLDNHRFIPLHRYCRAAATHIKRLEAALSALSEKQQETVGCNWPVCGCKTRCPSTPSETPLKTIIADLRVKNGKRPCGCESCDCANVGDAENVGSWDGADWVLNEIDKAIK